MIPVQHRSNTLSTPVYPACTSHYTGELLLVLGTPNVSRLMVWELMHAERSLKRRDWCRERFWGARGDLA